MDCGDEARLARELRGSAAVVGPRRCLSGGAAAPRPVGKQVALPRLDPREELAGGGEADFLRADPAPRRKIGITIDPTIRLNLGATYDLTGNLKLFGRVDNLLNRKNEQWLSYASQGLRLMAGATFSF